MKNYKVLMMVRAVEWPEVEANDVEEAIKIATTYPQVQQYGDELVAFLALGETEMDMGFQLYTMPKEALQT